MSDAYVECSDCHRHVRCAVMTDGTVYRPFAWVYPFEDQFLGVCGGCQANRQADDLIARVQACKTVEEYAAVKREFGLDTDVQRTDGGNDGR